MDSGFVLRTPRNDDGQKNPVLPPRPYSSYAGLTRVSIHLRKKHFAKKMDCRVKPGNDDVKMKPA
jgi:hypothetical protein